MSASLSRTQPSSALMLNGIAIPTNPELSAIGATKHRAATSIRIFQFLRVVSNDVVTAYSSQHARSTEQKRVSSAGSVVVGHMTPTQRGNLIIGRLNLTADKQLKAGAFCGICGKLPMSGE
jgi:hypothetical protein